MRAGTRRPRMASRQRIIKSISDILVPPVTGCRERRIEHPRQVGSREADIRKLAIGH